MIDSTFLDIQKSDNTYQFGRDYIAHAVRWSLLQKILINESRELRRPIIVYDVGCGRKMPLAQTIFANRHYDIIHSMWCFDQVIEPSRNFTVGGVQKVLPVVGDFCQTYTSVVNNYPPDVIVSFEAFEHMPFKHSWTFLRAIRRCCHADTTFYFSTPNYSHTRGAAKNHQNECALTLVKCMLENCGFNVAEMHGLYCELKRAEEYCTARGCSDLYVALKERFENEVLSMIFSWDIPEESKNVLYACTPIIDGRATATDQDVIDLANDPMFRQIS